MPDRRSLRGISNSAISTTFRPAELAHPTAPRSAFLSVTVGTHRQRPPRSAFMSMSPPIHRRLSPAAPTTSSPLLALDPSGVTALTVDSFPYWDADDDPLSHITILSLPTSGELRLADQTVNTGQQISIGELQAGSLELWLSPSSGGNAATSFSFSVSDGIDSSAAATMAATYVAPTNARPLTWTAAITASPNEIAFLICRRFPLRTPMVTSSHTSRSTRFPPVRRSSIPWETPWCCQQH